jgi:hypothetical protein
MIYLVIAYIDDTTLGLSCDNFYVENGCLCTVDEYKIIKDVVPFSQVKIISQISEEEFEAHKLEDEDDGEPEPGTMGLPFP